MAQIKLRRTALRSTFTRSANQLQALLDGGDTTTEIHLEIALERLMEKRDQLKITQDEYLTLLQSTSTCTEISYEEEMVATEPYYDRYNELKVMARKRLKTISSGTSAGKIYKIPEIELVKFNGDLKNWLPFWTKFEMIHNDPRIDRRDKFSYLLQSIEVNSKARKIFESYPASSDNYEAAILCLKERFSSESVLIQIYIRDLLKLVTSDKSKVDLSSLYDQLMTHLRSLKAVGLTQDKFADLFYTGHSTSSDPIFRKFFPLGPSIR